MWGMQRALRKQAPGDCSRGLGTSPGCCRGPSIEAACALALRAYPCTQCHPPSQPSLGPVHSMACFVNAPTRQPHVPLPGPHLLLQGPLPLTPGAGGDSEWTLWGGTRLTDRKA